MNIRDVVKNTDSFCGSRPADGATSYYSIRLCSLTPNGLFFPLKGVNSQSAAPYSNALKIPMKVWFFFFFSFFLKHLGTKTVEKWPYVAEYFF